MRQFLDPFLLGIIFSVCLAYWFPELTLAFSGQLLDGIASIGIALIFFFYGVKLDLNQFKSDLANWKLHLLVQLVTFLLFPLLILPFKFLIENEYEHQIWLGFLFLAVLPSTVSSSVVMVSLAKGNISAAIFNASISGLIGVVMTPLWLSFFLTQKSSDFDLSHTYLQLFTQILVPVFIGVLLHTKLSKWANKHRFALSWFDKCIILIIIFKSFGRSFASELFSDISWLEICGVGVGVVVLFFFIYMLINRLSKMLNFSIPDQITAKFCGTKKSLVHGSVFAKILLPASLPLGIILLPIMLYHAFQLFVISFFANQYAKKN
ncbi:MAG: bile acid:sodium symporter [Flavobacteriaceae bacterium]|nr:bile acid:sodium symporter [Flavobacteriaceae bacterium]